jgi:hypothetical protein
MALVTVTADFGRADESDAEGWVSIRPWLDAVHTVPDLELITRARLRSPLVAGMWTADVIASDDPAWQASGPVPYFVEWTVSGSYATRIIELPAPGPWSLWELVDLADPTVTPIPVPGPVGPAGPVGPQGPQGDSIQGPQGVQGLQGEVSVASTATGAPGTAAAVTDSDASPNRAALVFTIPRGDVGATGPAIGGILTTKGDLAARDATTAVRLGVGTAGQVLQADPATATGLKWANDAQVTHPNVDDVLVQQWDAGKGRWQTVHYDSGWRDISGLLINGWTAGEAIRAKRVNERVTLLGAGLYWAAAGHGSVLVSMPAGFLPVALPGVYGPPFTSAYRHKGYGGTLLGGVFTYGDGRVDIAFQADPGAAGNIGGAWFEGSYTTPDPIPTSLPGTLVSAAPALTVEEG